MSQGLYFRHPERPAWGGPLPSAAAFPSLGALRLVGGTPAGHVPADNRCPYPRRAPAAPRRLPLLLGLHTLMRLLAHATVHSNIPLAPCSAAAVISHSMLGCLQRPHSAPFAAADLDPPSSAPHAF